jgi:protein O-GlcNAc transferase
MKNIMGVTMKKLISFSLWGDKPKYTVGAVKNAKLALDIYPGWICRYYVGDDVPQNILDQLVAFSHVELVYMKSELWDSMFWRFYAASDPEAQVMISRDTDSRLNKREKAAVDAWLSGGKVFHIMRDHSWHAVPILGGMWGCRGDTLRGMEKWAKDYLAKAKKSNYYQVDQEFLTRIIFPKIQHSCIIHDSRFPDRHPWPVARENNEYVGSPYDENDKLLIPYK